MANKTCRNVTSHVENQCVRNYIEKQYVSKKLCRKICVILHYVIQALFANYVALNLSLPVRDNEGYVTSFCPG